MGKTYYCVIIDEIDGYMIQELNLSNLSVLNDQIVSVHTSSNEAEFALARLLCL